MDRTFQSKVGWAYRLLLGSSSLVLFILFWVHCVLAACVAAIIVIFQIEMLVHTHYVVTRDVLHIHSGRFVRNVNIPLNQIRIIRQVWSARPAPALSCRRLRLGWTGEDGCRREVMVSPVNPDAFLACIRKAVPDVPVENLHEK